MNSSDEYWMCLMQEVYVNTDRSDRCSESGGYLCTSAQLVLGKRSVIFAKSPGGAVKYLC